MSLLGVLLGISNNELNKILVLLRSIIYLETPFSASTGVVKQRFRLNKKKTLSFKRYRVKKTN